MKKDKQEEKKQQKQIRKEAIIKTAITFIASLLTSLILPLLISLIFVGFNRNPKDILWSFFTNGTIMTIVISHIITYVTNFFDTAYIFYDPRLWMLSENNEIEASEARFFFGSFGLLIMSMISLISFWTFPNPFKLTWSIVFSVIFAVIILILDILFNYKLTLKREKEKTEKYEMLEVLSALNKDQEEMENSKKKTEFQGGSL